METKKHSILCKPFIAIARLFSHTHKSFSHVVQAVPVFLGVGFLLRFAGKYISS